MLSGMIRSVATAAALCTLAALPALAQQGLDEPFQGAFKQALAGSFGDWI